MARATSFDAPLGKIDFLALPFAACVVSQHFVVEPKPFWAASVFTVRKNAAASTAQMIYR
jgi:hypothetical protein